jgi:hypothetical protein
VTSTTATGQPHALAYVKRPAAELERALLVGGAPCHVRRIVGVG